MTCICGVVFLLGELFHVKNGSDLRRMAHNHSSRSTWPGRLFPCVENFLHWQEAVAGTGVVQKRLNFYISDFGLPAAGIEIVAQYREATRYFSPVNLRVGLV